MNPGADIHLFGQEVNPETFAICKADLFMKSADGRDAENVVFGSTLSNDRHDGAGFDYMIACPADSRAWHGRPPRARPRAARHRERAAR